MSKRHSLLIATVGLPIFVLSLGAAVSKEDGTKLFNDGKCTMCHTANVAGITKDPAPKGGDLPTSLAGKSADFVKNVVTKKEQVGGKTHAFEFKGSPENLDKLAGWLAQISGEALMSKNKCTMCHTVASMGITKDKAMGGDLSKVGAARKSQWIQDYVAKKVKNGDKEHKASFSGTPEDLKALGNWLETLK